MENINKFTIATYKYQYFKPQRFKADKDITVHVALRKADGKYFYSNGKEAIIGEQCDGTGNSVKFKWDDIQKKIVKEAKGYFDDCNRDFNAKDNDWVISRIQPYEFERFKIDGWVIGKGIIPKDTPYYIDWAIDSRLSKTIILTDVNTI